MALNIFGAFNEGLSGDTTILFSKAVIDIFASIIFATRLGYPMLLITIPQFIIMGGLFFCSQFLMVFISNTMILDFYLYWWIIDYYFKLEYDWHFYCQHC